MKNIMEDSLKKIKLFTNKVNNLGKSVEIYFKTKEENKGYGVIYFKGKVNYRLGGNSFVGLKFFFFQFIEFVLWCSLLKLKFKIYSNLYYLYFQEQFAFFEDILFFRKYLDKLYNYYLFLLIVNIVDFSVYFLTLALVWYPVCFVSIFNNHMGLEKVSFIFLIFSNILFPFILYYLTLRLFYFVFSADNRVNLSSKSKVNKLFLNQNFKKFVIKFYLFLRGRVVTDIFYKKVLLSTLLPVKELHKGQKVPLFRLLAQNYFFTFFDLHTLYEDPFDEFNDGEDLKERSVVSFAADFSLDRVATEFFSNTEDSLGESPFFNNSLNFLMPDSNALFDKEEYSRLKYKWSLSDAIFEFTPEGLFKETNFFHEYARREADFQNFQRNHLHLNPCFIGCFLLFFYSTIFKHGLDFVIFYYNSLISEIYTPEVFDSPFAPFANFDYMGMSKLRLYDFFPYGFVDLHTFSNFEKYLFMSDSIVFFYGNTHIFSYFFEFYNLLIDFFYKPGEFGDSYLLFEFWITLIQNNLFDQTDYFPYGGMRNSFDTGGNFGDNLFFQNIIYHNVRELLYSLDHSFRKGIFWYRYQFSGGGLFGEEVYNKFDKTLALDRYKIVYLKNLYSKDLYELEKKNYILTKDIYDYYLNNKSKIFNIWKIFPGDFKTEVKVSFNNLYFIKDNYNYLESFLWDGNNYNYSGTLSSVHKKVGSSLSLSTFYKNYLGDLKVFLNEKSLFVKGGDELFFVKDVSLRQNYFNLVRDFFFLKRRYHINSLIHDIAEVSENGYFITYRSFFLSQFCYLKNEREGDLNYFRFSLYLNIITNLFPHQRLASERDSLLGLGNSLGELKVNVPKGFLGHAENSFFYKSIFKDFLSYKTSTRYMSTEHLREYYKSYYKEGPRVNAYKRMIRSSLSGDREKYLKKYKYGLEKGVFGFADVTRGVGELSDEVSLKREYALYDYLFGYYSNLNKMADYYGKKDYGINYFEPTRYFFNDFSTQLNVIPVFLQEFVFHYDYFYSLNQQSWPDIFDILYLDKEKAYGLNEPGLASKSILKQFVNEVEGSMGLQQVNIYKPNKQNRESMLLRNLIYKENFMLKKNHFYNLGLSKKNDLGIKAGYLSSLFFFNLQAKFLPVDYLNYYAEKLTFLFDPSVAPVLKELSYDGYDMQTFGLHDSTKRTPKVSRFLFKCKPRLFKRETVGPVKEAVMGNISAAGMRDYLNDAHSLISKDKIHAPFFYQYPYLPKRGQIPNYKFIDTSFMDPMLKRKFRDTVIHMVYDHYPRKRGYSDVNYLGNYPMIPGDIRTKFDGISAYGFMRKYGELLRYHNDLGLYRHKEGFGETPVSRVQHFPAMEDIYAPDTENGIPFSPTYSRARHAIAMIPNEDRFFIRHNKDSGPVFTELMKGKVLAGGALPILKEVMGGDSTLVSLFASRFDYKSNLLGGVYFPLHQKTSLVNPMLSRSNRWDSKIINDSYFESIMARFMYYLLGEHQNILHNYERNPTPAQSFLDHLLWEQVGRNSTWIGKPEESQYARKWVGEYFEGARLSAEGRKLTDGGRSAVPEHSQNLQLAPCGAEYIHYAIPPFSYYRSRLMLGEFMSRSGYSTDVLNLYYPNSKRPHQLGIYWDIFNPYNRKKHFRGFFREPLTRFFPFPEDIQSKLLVRNTLPLRGDPREMDYFFIRNSEVDFFYDPSGSPYLEYSFWNTFFVFITAIFFFTHNGSARFNSGFGFDNALSRMVSLKRYPPFDSEGITRKWYKSPRIKSFDNTYVGMYYDSESFYILLHVFLGTFYFILFFYFLYYLYQEIIFFFYKEYGIMFKNYWYSDWLWYRINFLDLKSNLQKKQHLVVWSLNKNYINDFLFYKKYPSLFVNNSNMKIPLILIQNFEDVFEELGDPCLKFSVVKPVFPFYSFYHEKDSKFKTYLSSKFFFSPFFYLIMIFSNRFLDNFIGRETKYNYPDNKDGGFVDSGVYSFYLSFVTGYFLNQNLKKFYFFIKKRGLIRHKRLFLKEYKKFWREYL